MLLLKIKKKKIINNYIKNELWVYLDIFFYELRNVFFLLLFQIVMFLIWLIFKIVKYNILDFLLNKGIEIIFIFSVIVF